ncbi:hypothetical protein WJX72_001416 [[Myrmecia] bisecta]|uniref:Apple domain-containing protein n=1 Tax=[Myrmecia] bisecta TaxID=41462 RepID=A0AAW1R4I8_9CHLO
MALAAPSSTVPLAEQGQVAFLQVLPGADKDGRCNICQATPNADGTVTYGALSTAAQIGLTARQTATFALDWSHMPAPSMSKDSEVTLSVRDSAQQSLRSASASISKAAAVKALNGGLPHYVLHLAAAGGEATASFDGTARSLLQRVTLTRARPGSVLVSFELSNASLQSSTTCRLEVAFTVAADTAVSSSGQHSTAALLSYHRDHALQAPAYRAYESTTLGDCIASGTVRPSKAYHAFVKMKGSRAGVCTIQQGSAVSSGARISLGSLDSGSLTFIGFPDGAALMSINVREKWTDGRSKEPQSVDITPVTVGPSIAAFERQGIRLDGAPGTLAILYQAAEAGADGAAKVLPKAMTFKPETYTHHKPSGPSAGTVGYSVTVTFTIAVEKTAGSCLLRTTFAITHPGLGPDVDGQALKYRLYPYMAAPGNESDHRYMGTALAPSYGDCAMQCMHDHKCKAFTYHKQICVLKNTTVAVASLRFMPPDQAPLPWYTGIDVSTETDDASGTKTGLDTVKAAIAILQRTWSGALEWLHRRYQETSTAEKEL